MAEEKTLNLERAQDIVDLPEDKMLEVLGLSEEKAPVEAEAAPKVEAKPEPVAEVKPATEAKVEAEAEAKAEAVPEAVEATQAKPPLTKFQVFDPEGEIEVPELTFTYKASGKMKENVPLEKVILLAQMGEYNTEREQQVLGAKQFVEATRTQNDQLRSQVQEYDQWFHRVFTDPEYLERAKEAYEQQNSPEERASRAEERATAMQTQMQQAAAEGQAVAFVNQQIVPTVTKLIESNPLVSEQEVVGYYTSLTAPLLQSGRVPLYRLGDVKGLVDGDLANWVRSRQLQRETDRKSVDVKLTAAKTATTLAKRQIAKAVAPKGVPAPAGPPKAKKPTSVEDWLDITLPLQRQTEE